MNIIDYKEDEKCNAAIIVINRPKQLNALNKRVFEGLEKTLDKVERNSKIRSVIITGSEDKAFVAGADIKEFSTFSREDAKVLSNTGKEKVFNRVSNFSKPTIAAINGYALGGGLELALSCHIRVAVKSASLGLPECSLGLIPGYSGTQRLPRLVGRANAMEMILGSKIINSEEAYRIGLVNYVVDSGELLEKCCEISKSISKNPPEALSAAIKSINSCYDPNGEQVETESFSDLFDTSNFKEGVAAFLDKRKPNFR